MGGSGQGTGVRVAVQRAYLRDDGRGVPVECLHVGRIAQCRHPRRRRGAGLVCFCSGVHHSAPISRATSSAGQYAGRPTILGGANLCHAEVVADGVLCGLSKLSSRISAAAWVRSRNCLSCRAFAVTGGPRFGADGLPGP